MRWLQIARTYCGVREFKGVQHSPVILRWLALLGAWWRDDETPWCGVFVGAVLKEAGIKPAAAWYRARAWLDWGVSLSAPAAGAVVVFDRSGGGHVGFVVGRSPAGNLLVLGGNQGDEVNVRAFPDERVLGYRWPPGEPAPPAGPLPTLASAAASTSEA